MEFVFVIITLLALVGLYLGSNKKVTSIFMGWTILSGVLSYSGFWQETSTFPPRFIFIILPTIVLVFFCYKITKSENLNMKWLIAIHILRIPVELILFKLFLLGQIPELMTFNGWNWDIVSGISAIPILILFAQKKLNNYVFITWNWIAIFLLFVIIVSAVLSAPSPFQQFAFEQPNVGLLQFPFTWLPAVVVPIVLLSHLLMLKNIQFPQNR